MTIANDEMKIGILLGRFLIKDEEQATDIIIYKRNSQNKLRLEKCREFKHSDACSSFHFKSFDFHFNF